MDALKLLESHQYDAAIAAIRRDLAQNPDDWAAIGALAIAYRAAGDYVAALPLFEKASANRRRRLPGSPGHQEDISCLHWMMGDRITAISLMRGLASGILDKSVLYADIAGGVEQGILLYYMAVTVEDKDIASYALKYLKKRDKRSRSGRASFPGPAGQYLLGEISFQDMLENATGERALPDATERARTDLLSRRNLCVALFHDGVKSRAVGDEAGCLERMGQCYDLEDPLIEQEWYLARREVQKIAQDQL